MDKKQIIREYLEAGKKLMPVNGRKPIRKDWVEAEFSEEEIYNHKGNIGWVLGERDLVIDIDPRNGGDESFKALLRDLNIDLIPTVITGGVYEECPSKDGKHIYLTIPESYTGYKFRKVLNKEYPGIDFLTKGAYCIIPGSITDREYTWYDDDIEGFYQTKTWESILELIAYKVKDDKTCDHFDDLLNDKSSDWSEETVIEYINKLDNNLPNTEWVKVGMALHDWHPVEGLRLWEEWSKGGETYIEGETTKRWSSFDSGGGVSLGTLVYMVKEVDFDNNQFIRTNYIEQIEKADEKLLTFTIIPRMVDEDFNEIDKAVVVVALQSRFKELTGAKMAVSKVRKMIESKTLSGYIMTDADMPKWCDEWIYINSHTGYFNKRTYQICKTAAFDLINGKHIIPNDAGAKQTASRFVADNSFIPFASSMAYLPQEPELLCEFNGLTVVNSFNPNTVPVEAVEYTESGKRMIESFNKHLQFLFGNDKDTKIFVQWLAHNIQFPGKKILWSPVIQSIEGVGKSYIGKVLRACLGSANVGVVSPAQVVSDYNLWATGKCVVILEEIKMTGHSRYDALNSLKPIITDSTIMINGKHINQYETWNTVNPIAFTNHKDALPIEETDRRFWIKFVDLNSLKELIDKVGMTAEEYFPPLFDALDNHADELRKWLLEYPITKEFMKLKTAPMTDSKLSMIATEESKFEGFMEIREMLEEGGQYYNTVCISSSDLFHDLLLNHGIDVNNSQKHILLKKLRFTIIPGVVKINGKARRIWTKKPMSKDEIRLQFTKQIEDQSEF